VVACRAVIGEPPLMERLVELFKDLNWSNLSLKAEKNIEMF